MRAILGALVLCVAGAAAAQTSAPRMHLVEDLRIEGKQMGFDERPLSFLLVTPRGRMAYVDQYRFRVNFFDAAGNHIGDFGGKGSGAGEFSVARANAGERSDLSGGTVGDSIWLYDRYFPQARVTYLSSKGDFLRTVDASEGPASAASNSSNAHRPALSLVGAFTDGGVLWRESFATSECDAGADGQRTCSSRTDSLVLIRVSKGADSERRVAAIRTDAGYVTVSGVTLRAPFAVSPTVVVAPDGNRAVILSWRAASASAGTVALVAVSARGDTLFSRQYPFGGTSVDPQHADNLVEQLIRDYDRVDASGAHAIDPRTVGEFKRKLRAGVPLSRSSVLSVRIGLDNSLWMPMSEGTGARSWLVFDERGDPFGSVLLPASVGNIAQFTKSNVWVIERPNEGRPSIVRYRVVPGPQ